jgi:hypothetical protein
LLQRGTKDGGIVRGGWNGAHNTPWFNPHTFFYDYDTPGTAGSRDPRAIWWNDSHELGHAWDERSHIFETRDMSGRMNGWVADNGGEEYRHASSYAITGGAGEDFAESVAATITGYGPDEYYGSARDQYVIGMLAHCRGQGCLDGR